MSKPYILHIASWYPSEVNAYDGDFIQRHIESIPGYKHIVIHAQEIPQGEGNTEQGKVTNDANGSIEQHIVYYKPVVRFLNPLYQYYYLYKLWNEIKANNGIPLLIHLHVLLYGILLSRAIKRRYHIPIVATEHSTLYTTDDPVSFRKLRIRCSRFLSSTVDLIMPVSNHLAKALKMHGFQNDIAVVHNVVPAIFEYDRCMEDKRDIVRFLHISSLDNKQKNIEGILMATKKLLDITDQFELTIVGNYNLDSSQSMIYRFGFNEGQVMLKGPMTHQEVATQMKANDVFVLFSNYENYPCVLIEAQTAGMRLIATDVGGVSEILDPQKDTLIDKRDINALTQAMESYINNRTTVATKRDKIKRYSPSLIGNQLLSIYNRTIA